MKFLLLFAIKIYWHFWEEKERRHCIFRESCSKYVYKITKEQGGIAGLKTLKDRYCACRPGYMCFTENGNMYLKLADGSVITGEEASPEVMAPYKRTISELEESFNSVF